MRPRPLPLAFTLLVAASPVAAGQAQGWADMWRVLGTTVAGPTPLERGPTGMFWNPAAAADLPGLGVGIEVVHTPDVLGIGGIVAGLTQRIGTGLAVGAVVGRLDVEDLIRTTTSPTSRDGTIPVYTQFAAVGAGATVAGVRIGAQVRAHDARFDTVRDRNVTADVGLRAAPLDWLTVAFATHFAEPVFRRGPGTAYTGAIELALATTTIWGSRFLIIGQYGASAEERAGLEHTLTAGLALDDRLRLDWGWSREQGYGTGAWRPTLAIWFRTGRYRIAVARGDGLNGLGATFRLGLNAEILR